MNLIVLVTISHSAPYGFQDAAVLMDSFLSSSHIDFLSPQLYTSGTETQNDYATSHGVTWQSYAGARPQIIPSIVTSNLYQDARNYFRNCGVNTTGYIQWKN